MNERRVHPVLIRYLSVRVNHTLLTHRVCPMGMRRKVLHEVRKVENTKINYEARCTLLFKAEEVRRDHNLYSRDARVQRPRWGFGAKLRSSLLGILDTSVSLENIHFHNMGGFPG
jgi:hypothetical protein